MIIRDHQEHQESHQEPPGTHQELPLSCSVFIFQEGFDFFQKKGGGILKEDSSNMTDFYET